jgi:hypothetical protein
MSTERRGVVDRSLTGESEDKGQQGELRGRTAMALVTARLGSRPIASLDPVRVAAHRDIAGPQERRLSHASPVIRLKFDCYPPDFEPLAHDEGPQSC